MSSPAIKEAMTASECYVMNDKSYQEYLAREYAILDYNNDVLGNRRLGREEGRAEGLDAFAALSRSLLAEKRYDDLARAASDAAYRQKLLTELGIE